MVWAWRRLQSTLVRHRDEIELEVCAQTLNNTMQRYRMLVLAASYDHGGCSFIALEKPTRDLPSYLPLQGAKEPSFRPDSLNRQKADKETGPIRKCNR